MERLKNFFREDPHRLLVFAFGFAYVLFFSSGLPLWDDDYTSMFKRMEGKSALELIWNWIWFVSQQVGDWAFNERPPQLLLYRLFHWMSGYHSWTYLIFKDLFYAFLVSMIYFWVTRMTNHRGAGWAAALFYAFLPGPASAHLWMPDYGVVSQGFFAVFAWVGWQLIEKTPRKWVGFPSFRLSSVRSWGWRWLVYTVLLYLGYKLKGDLKGIPVLLFLYVACFRRSQWAYFIFPLSLMVFLAVPWGPGIFSKLPPWFPGSSGSQVSYMYKPAGVGRLADFVADSRWWDPHTLSISLLGNLAPFLLPGVALFLLYLEKTRKNGLNLFPIKTDKKRVLVFLFLWLGLDLLMVSTLPELNPVFRARYGVIPMVPTAILLGVLFSEFFREFKGHRLVFAMGLVLMVGQMTWGFYRTQLQRNQLGRLTISVGKAYGYLEEKFPTAKLVTLPDFRPFDQAVDAAPVLTQKVWVQNDEELKKVAVPGETLGLTWNPPLDARFEWMAFFDGCYRWNPWDWFFPCEPSSGAYLVRYVGTELLGQAQALASVGKNQEAAGVYENLLAKYPQDVGALFSLGLVYYAERDFRAMEATYGRAEAIFPWHLGILYNRALAMKELGRFEEAATRFLRVVEKDPTNFASLIHLYDCAEKLGRKGMAQRALDALVRFYPDDPTVQKLKGGGP